jgi:RNA polymerase sigma factor (sigma-70 family)
MFAQRLQGPPGTTRNHDLTYPETEVAGTTEADPDRALETFLAERTRLFRIARRVVGDVSSAEEVVQEAWLRWQRANRAEIRNSAAFLSTMTAHLAINVIQSAHHRRETPTESALADFIDVPQDPTGDTERIADVEEALNLLVAKLMPAELAAYLLRKGFDYPYRDIAHLLRTSVPNVRQLVRRAQPRIEGDQSRTVVGDVHDRLVTAFMASARTGDLKLLERILTDNARSALRCSTPAAQRRGRQGQDDVRSSATVADERPRGRDGRPGLDVVAVLGSVAEGDQVIPPDPQPRFAARMGATIVEGPTKQVVMVSRPDVVSSPITTAAEAVPARAAI